ncbi:MAG: arginine--tRNA ligase [Bacteroidetes bacterium]|jgi:arginyl-tRNA synthetase|nr:arginine--tRNA ligase [Bacteroidota bacterium]MDF2450795.1 arginine--tRNA ligase [Bacteroidota bacterium]
MNIEHFLSSGISPVINELFGLTTTPNDIILQKTKKEFEGDYTLVTFPYIKAAQTTPEKTGELIGEQLTKKHPSITQFNVVKGFLNLSLSNDFWLSEFKAISSETNFGIKPANSSGRQIMLEYSSPNTNKPLHLGHVRNNLLGYSVATIMKTQGHEVIKVNLVNDRGIHICKSMIAWKLFGHRETPQSSGLKGDHLVGKYYVEFDKVYKKEIQTLMDGGVSKEDAEKKAPIMLQTQEMLLKWEANDPDTIALWKMMNDWVYQGFAVSYKKLGVDFDKMYYESNTYLLGKEVVQDGLEKNIFYKKENGSVCIDLTQEGLDEKVVLRSDGTSVYITQDLGTAIERFKEFPKISQMIYTVGNEQDYHFKVLFKILGKLGYDWANECYHLSYGMVELPEGKMKSREGTVVDADDLMDGMVETAKETTEASGKVSEFSNEEKDQLFNTIGMGALKYFILKVDPKKKMLFDPKESIDLHGNTGPFIQYAHARIKSILRDYDENIETISISDSITLHEKEKELIKLQYDFPKILSESATTYNPAVVANYIYELARLFNQFYNECSVLKEGNPEVRKFRIKLIETTANIIKNGMSCLGIDVPERM